MKIYTFNENTSRAGQVCVRTFEDADWALANPDITLWGEGSETELIIQARQQYVRNAPRRAGEWAACEPSRREAINVLRYFGEGV